MEEDLNLLSEELLEQIFVYLNDIDWEEELLELKQNQLIKNLILSNQINNVTPTQIKIQF